MSLPPPRATLGALLDVEELELRRDPRVPVTTDALATPVLWVHNSDLADPTPFLSDGGVLLTTGTQFATNDAADIEDYVARLRSRGVLAVGFGTEVVREGIPAELAQSCARAGLPLFEVPYRIPFIAVIRAHAEALAAQNYARQAWALQAQNALTNAALQKNGLHATIVELAKQLGGWVGLYDATGTRTLSHAARAAPRPDDAFLEGEVTRLLRRGSTASTRLTREDLPVLLHTIGRRGRSGVLAVAGVSFDREARNIVNSVIATTGLALEQGTLVRRTDRRLRTTVIDFLSDGESNAAQKVAVAAWGGLPESPWLVVSAEKVRSDNAQAELDRLTTQLGTFVGEHDDEWLLIAPFSAADPLRRLFIDHNWRAGTSGCARGEDLPSALSAARAARGARRESPVIDVSELPHDLIIEFATPAATAAARHLLAPLHKHDLRNGTRLVGTLRLWLAADGSNEAAATELGIHRHTMRARIRTIQEILDVDLDSFTERANLWAGLRLTEQP